jgi:hypothetical protein
MYIYILFIYLFIYKSVESVWVITLRVFIEIIKIIEKIKIL